MAAVLTEAYGKLNPERAGYLVNDARAAYFQSFTSSDDIATLGNATLYYCYELLNAGRTEHAIHELEQFIPLLAWVTY